MALSINKSELARVLRVSRPTIYGWLDGGEPNSDNVERVQTLLRLLSESRVSADNPLFPRFVRSPLAAGGTCLIDLLCEDTLGESTVKNVILNAKVLGNAIHAQGEAREARLKAAGFEGPDAEQRKANLATNVALMGWPRE